MSAWPVQEKNHCPWSAIKQKMTMQAICTETPSWEHFPIDANWGGFSLVSCTEQWNIQATSGMNRRMQGVLILKWTADAARYSEKDPSFLSDICYFSACKSLRKSLLTGFQRAGWRCWEKENQAHSAFVVWAPSKKFLPGWMRRLLGPSALFDPFTVTLPQWFLLSSSIVCLQSSLHRREKGCVHSSSGYVSRWVNKKFKGASFGVVSWKIQVSPLP